MSKSKQQHMIDVRQLRVGLYVHLDLGWMDHPFTFSNFKIKDASQIATIRQLGLKRLRYDPLRSDCEPLAPEAETGTANDPATAPAPELEVQQPPDEEKLKVDRRMAELQRVVDECERKFVAASRIVREAGRVIRAQPQRAISETERLVNEMVNSILTESEIVIHALNGRRSSDDHYLHPLNVAVLALALAKSLDMTAEDACLLGMAALFHDAGKDEVPKKILMKTDPLTKAESSFLQQHCEFGARVARESGLAERVAEIIYQHHECQDGTGYPRQLKAQQIDPLARLLSIVNVYDNLCNPYHQVEARTPYEALAYMFATQRSKFDSTILNLLIKSLGVYPPGSLVMLSDGSYGIVISVNPSKPLRPYVMTYDSDIRNEAPLIIDLSEKPTISISECLRRSQLPDKVLERLNPRKRICYFIDSERPAGD